MFVIALKVLEGLLEARHCGKLLVSLVWFV